MPPAGAALNRVVCSNSALSHLRAIRAYLDQFNPGAARELAAALVEAGNSLALFPYRGRLVAGSDRRELATWDPYVIRDRIVGTDVRILRFATRRSSPPIRDASERRGISLAALTL